MNAFAASVGKDDTLNKVQIYESGEKGLLHTHTHTHKKKKGEKSH